MTPRRDSSYLIRIYNDFSKVLHASYLALPTYYILFAIQKINYCKQDFSIENKGIENALGTLKNTLGILRKTLRPLKHSQISSKKVSVFDRL